MGKEGGEHWYRAGDKGERIDRGRDLITLAPGQDQLAKSTAFISRWTYTEIKQPEAPREAQRQEKLEGEGSPEDRQGREGSR